MLIDRVESMATAGISVDVMTSVLRSEGHLDSDIAACYDSLARSGRYAVDVQRGIPWFRPLTPK